MGTNSLIDGGHGVKLHSRGGISAWLSPFTFEGRQQFLHSDLCQLSVAQLGAQRFIIEEELQVRLALKIRPATFSIACDGTPMTDEAWLIERRARVLQEGRRRNRRHCRG